MAEDKVLEAAKANVEAIENGFLEKLFPEKSAVEEKPAAEVAAEAAEDESPKGVSPEGEKESKKGEGAESDPEWEKACTTLNLDGVPRSVLDKLDRAEALEWASKAKERQAKTAKELKARADELKALKEGVTTPKEGEPVKAPTDHGDDADFKAIRDALGDELATPLAKWLERKTATELERVKAYDARIAQLEGQYVKALVDGARASLKEQFPQLDDPEKLEQVNAELQNHIHKYQDAEPAERARLAMRDAARVVLFDDVKASEAGKALASYRKRIGSQPTPPNGKTDKPKAMTASEREDALLDAIIRGDAQEKERLMRMG